MAEAARKNSSQPVMTRSEHRAALSRYRRDLRREVLSTLQTKELSCSSETNSLLPDASIPAGKTQTVMLFRFCTRLNAEVIFEDLFRFLSGEAFSDEECRFLEQIDSVVHAAEADDVGDGIDAIAVHLQQSEKSKGPEACHRYIDETLRGLMMGLNILNETEYNRWAKKPAIYEIKVVPET